MKNRTLLCLFILILISSCARTPMTPSPDLGNDAPSFETATQIPTPVVLTSLPTETELSSTKETNEPVATIPTPKEATATPTRELPSEPEVIADGLSYPWELVFLADRTVLLTERPGTLLIIATGQERIAIEGVKDFGEGGLLGMALHPDFEENHWLYLYSTYETAGHIQNRVERYVYRDYQLSDREIIIDGIHGEIYHNGGRIKFGPDGKLYITTGDAGSEQTAQNLNSLSGKILRLNDDGSIPGDNPFGTAIWTYGHRNAQGLAWDSQSRLWATEHGPSGYESGNDEINLIERGKNYGWPLVRGLETMEGMTAPVIESTREVTWAPSGAAIVDDTLYFTGLRGEALYRVPVDEMSLGNLDVLYKSEFGRIRNVVLAPDGRLWIMTSNGAGSDKIIALPFP